MFSVLLSSWIFPLLRVGTKKLLNLGDLYKPLKSDRSKCLAESLEKHWNDELLKSQHKGSKPSLLKALVKTFIKSYSIYALLLFITMICFKWIFFFINLKAVWNDQTFRTPQPLLLSWLVGLFEDEALYDRNAAYIAASGIVLLSLVSVIFFHHVNCGTLTTGMKIRVAVSSLLNRKVSSQFFLRSFCTGFMSWWRSSRTETLVVSEATGRITSYL